MSILRERLLSISVSVVANFNDIVRANMEADAGMRLPESELIGQMSFVLIVFRRRVSIAHSHSQHFDFRSV